MDTINQRSTPVRNRALLIFVLIFLFCLPSLWAGMMGDDYMHYAIFEADNLPIEKPDDLSLFGLFSFINGDPERNRQAMDLGVIPWWTYSGMKYAFWRPLSEITHWIDYQLWPRSPAMMHLHNVLWYLGVCWLAFILYRRTLMTGGVALLALFLYGLDSTHGFGVSWIANRNGLIAAFFGLASFACFMRWRESDSIGMLFASLVLQLLALLAAEIGISTFGYLGAYALCSDPKGRLKGILACIPHFAVIAAWWIFYKAAGFGAANADAYYVDPAAQPLSFLSMFLQRYPVLLASQWGIIPSELFGYGLLKGTGFVVASSIFVVVILGFVGLAAIKQPLTRMWFLGMLFSLIPATSALPQDRVLIFTGIGASALLANFLYLVFRQPKTLLPIPVWLNKTVGGVLILLHLVLGTLLLPLSCYSTKLFWSNAISQAPSELQGIEDVEGKKLVIVGPPLASGLAIAPFRFYRGDPMPDKIWLISSLDQDIKFHVADQHTVELTLDAGFIQGPEVSVRDFKRFPFAKGETIPLTGMTITVEDLNEKGMPRKLALRFAQAINESQVKFLRWNTTDKQYEAVIFD